MCRQHRFLPWDQKMDRDTFDVTLRTLKTSQPFRPFTVAMVNGVALFVAPGRVPVWFDHEGVSQVIGELAGQSPV
jgi:hypothetical protein